jgi:hypothetical protein
MHDAIARQNGRAETLERLKRGRLTGADAAGKSDERDA